MALTLYFNPQSRAVMSRFLLEEIGVPYTVKSLSYEDGSFRSPDFLAINPMGKVPALTDGDVVVTETTAIAIYLADKYKTPNDLAPAIDDPRRGDYLRWLVFQGACFDSAMMAKSAKIDVPREQAGWGSPELVMQVLEERLSKADPWLLGDWFTAADVILGNAVSWGVQFKVFEATPAIAAYIERVTSRPAFARARAPVEETA